MNKYQNPILAGFYPDPSICRVGEDYYMVTSTFSYFPGIPVFHSRDLVHWNQIGNVLNRQSQISLKGDDHSDGIYAPTIRYNNGIFYLTTTNVGGMGNFVVTATDAAGPWSEPIFLDAEGIDPSLFFDDGGKCYYCNTKDRATGAEYYGDKQIFVSELNLDTMTLVGESYPVWHGAVENCIWPEGPHIYKKDGWYYLMISEGGTGHQHAVTIARSKSITEYFEGYNCNPILTHRHLGRNYPIVNVGHADIVETQNGEWWMVLLASRPYGGYYRNLGRETFLVPLVWEDGWPVINPGVGKVEEYSNVPDLPYFESQPVKEFEDFDDVALPKHFMYLRNPVESNYSLAERKGYLRIYLSPVNINELESPSFVCQRQTSMSYIAETSFEFIPKDGERAGIALYQSNEYYYSLSIKKDRGKSLVELIQCKNGNESVIAVNEVTDGNTELTLKVYANMQNLYFAYKTADDDEYMILAKDIDGRILSTDIAGGFVGTCIGLFGVCKNTDNKNYADFDWFRLIRL